MTSRLHKVIVLTLFVAAMVGPAAYAILRGQAEFALMAAVGLILLICVLRSPYRLPVVLMVICLLSADSHLPLIKVMGLKLRWAVLGALVFKELGAWAFTKELRMRLTAVHLTLLAFILLALSSSLYSVDPMITFQRSVSIVMFFAVIFLYFWRQTTTEENRFDLIRFAASLVPVLYLTEAAYALAQPGAAWSGGRLRCISGNPNGLGLLVMLTLPILYWWWIRGSERGGLTLRAYQIGGVLLGVGLLLLSGSRASMLGVSACLFLVTLRLAPRYLASLVFVVLLAVIVHLAGAGGLLRPDLAGMERTTERLVNPDMGGRAEAWAKALSVGATRPFFGHGFGTTIETFGRLEFEKHFGGYPHNFLLHMFIDLGGFGAFLVLLMHLVLLRTAWRILASPAARTERGAPALAAGLYVAGVLNASFESWMFSAGSPGAFPFWLATMLTVRYALLHEQATRDRLHAQAPGWAGARH